MKTNLLRAFRISVIAGLAIWAHDVRAQASGECSSGFCGTPQDNGGGCGCGCGCSVLVDYTDIGVTYSTSDLDPDHDGIPSAIVDSNGKQVLMDNCPFTFNPDQSDGDGDKVGDACDNCRTVANADQFTLGAHKDANGWPIGAACDPDADGDGIANASDNCPFASNADQAKFLNSATLGDACNPDIDGDGVSNVVGAAHYDNCPYLANPDQAVPSDSTSSAAGHCNKDTDADSILDSVDNCPGVPNMDQKKSVVADQYMGDPANKYLGDACSPDIDGDVIVNSSDNCPTVYNPDQKDTDNDGVGDMCQKTVYCYHMIRSSSDCMDPTGTFHVAPFAATVYNGSTNVFTATTGNAVQLDIFANRDNVGIKYTWIVDSKPAGSNVGVKAAIGAVSTSVSYHYEYSAAPPTFTPDVAGTYTIRLSADLVSPDPLFAAHSHDETTFNLLVTGENKSQTGGCSASPAAPNGGSSLIFVGLMFALGLAIRTFRKQNS